MLERMSEADEFSIENAGGLGVEAGASEDFSRVSESTKSRTEKPAVYPDRFPVPEDKANWESEYDKYDPSYFVAQVVLDNEGIWAEPEDIKQVNMPTHSYVGEVKYNEKGYPLNPLTRTGIEGRGLLGKWGPNFAADPIISRTNAETGAFEVVVIQRDNGEWAIPGGMVDEGEDVSQTLQREFEEEAGVSLDMSQAEMIYKGYVDDPRNTDNAWLETTAKHLHLPSEVADKAHFEAGDDAKDVKWLSITPESIATLYASHGKMIKKAFDLYTQKNNQA